MLGGKLAAEVIADRAVGNPTKGLKEVQPDIVAAAAAYEPKDPPGVKGDGAIAFGGGAVLSQKGMDYLREFDQAQFDPEDLAAPPAPPAESAKEPAGV